MTKLSLSEDIYSRKSLKRSSSYENNQVGIDVGSVLFPTYYQYVDDNTDAFKLGKLRYMAYRYTPP